MSNANMKLHILRTFSNSKSIFNKYQNKQKPQAYSDCCSVTVAVGSQFSFCICSNIRIGERGRCPCKYYSWSPVIHKLTFTRG